MSSPDNRYLIISVICHLVVVLVLVIGFQFAKPLTVVENTNKNDVISAVVLGDSVKSKLMPRKPPMPEPKPEPVKLKEAVKELPKEVPPKEVPPKEVPPKEEPKEAPKQLAKPKESVQEKKPEIKKDVIALNKPTPKKTAVKKPVPFHPDDLLDDLKKMTQKQKKLAQKQKQVKEKQLQEKFAKTLRQQAEKSMRQNLLDEDIKLTGSELRQAQGVVDKYQALVKQAISEHWLIPPQVNKKLACTLMIRTAPGGTVLEVRVTKSSGEPMLDSSARAAVMKSSPLPVPKDTANFEPFRRFELIMKPETFIN